jgi:hypothetical protein
VNYRLLIDYEVIEFMEALPRKEQRLLRNRLLAIESSPSLHVDYTESDDTGRPVGINICGKYAIKFWEDHADRHVKILDLHLADESR